MPRNVPESKNRKGVRISARTSFVCAACAIALVGAPAASIASAVFSPAPSPKAFAEDINTEPTADELQTQVEQSAQEYDAAVARVADLQQQIADNQAAIDQLSEQLPEQRERAAAAAAELYKAQQSTGSLLDLILSAANFNDFVNKVEFINRITQQNVDELAQLDALQQQLEQAQSDLAAQEADASAQAYAADQALTQAQAARVEAQRKAQEEAQQQAEAAAAAEAAAQAAAAAASTDGSQQSSDNGATAQAMQAADATDASAAASDSADWTSDEDKFVSEWTARIDAYLAGSALAGEGRAFAQAAWDYGVDPRWSPAIAYVESSLGAACFYPYNAWGWGSSSWSSWDEAIDAHVRGLARGYGYTLSWDAAAKYCPPNTSHWYNTCLEQMNLI